MGTEYRLMCMEPLDERHNKLNNSILLYVFYNNKELLLWTCLATSSDKLIPQLDRFEQFLILFLPCVAQRCLVVRLDAPDKMGFDSLTLM